MRGGGAVLIPPLGKPPEAPEKGTEVTEAGAGRESRASVGYLAVKSGLEASRNLFFWADCRLEVYVREAGGGWGPGGALQAAARVAQGFRGARG